MKIHPKKGAVCAGHLVTVASRPSTEVAFVEAAVKPGYIQVSRYMPSQRLTVARSTCQRVTVEYEVDDIVYSRHLKHGGRVTAVTWATKDTQQLKVERMGRDPAVWTQQEHGLVPVVDAAAFAVQAKADAEAQRQHDLRTEIRDMLAHRRWQTPSTKSDLRQLLGSSADRGGYPPWVPLGAIYPATYPPRGAYDPSGLSSRGESETVTISLSRAATLMENAQSLEAVQAQRDALRQALREILDNVHDDATMQAVLAAVKHALTQNPMK